MLVTTFWSLRKVVMKWAFRERFGCGVGSFGFEGTAMADYCAQGDEPWGSKYYGIL